MANEMQHWKCVASTLIATLLPAAAAIGVYLMAGSAAMAQTYPSKVIKVICSVSPGSVIDATARLVMNDLSERLGKPVIVENRPGAGGVIGVREFARATADGYTLLFGSIGDAFATKVVGHDPAKDFVPVAAVSTLSWILVVRPTFPAKSVRELIEYAKDNPGKVNWGYGQGTSPHMFGEMFKAETGINVVGIPYKSGSLAVPDIVGGRIDMNFGAVSNLLPLIREGKLRAIAITSEARRPDLPDVPTMVESGFPRLTRGDWTGLWAPAGTPANIVSRLNSEVNVGLAAPGMKAAMKKRDFEPRVGSPQDFARFILDEVDAWTPAAKAAGILPN